MASRPRWLPRRRSLREEARTERKGGRCFNHLPDCAGELDTLFESWLLVVVAFDIQEEQVAVAEEALRRRLPPIYRAIMMANNGGSAYDNQDQWDIHPIRDASDRKRLSRSCNDILLETQAALQWERFPVDALAIGGNGFGDVMILLPSESDPAGYGDRIFAFWHETGDVKLLAEDFSAFEIE